MLICIYDIHKFHMKLIYQTTCEIKHMCIVRGSRGPKCNTFSFSISIFIIEICLYAGFVTDVFALCTNIISPVVFIKQTYSASSTYILCIYAIQLRRRRCTFVNFVWIDISGEIGKLVWPSLTIYTNTVVGSEYSNQDLAAGN